MSRPSLEASLDDSAAADGVDGDGAAEQEKFYYLAYGAELHPKLLAARLGPIKPLSSHTVRVESAFLSFDLRGVPYLEPCFTSALVQGVNDGHWTEEGRESEGYRRWIWERCCPGLEFDGELPPRLEGVAYELSPSHFASVMNTSTSSSAETSSNSSSSAAPSHRVIPISCTIFTHGDASKPLGTLVAHMPLGAESSRAAGLQPTLKYLRLVLIGAFFATCSQPYLGHLTLLRPFQPATLRKKATSYLFTFLLLPPFLFIHLPTRLARRVFGEGFGLGRLGKWVEKRGWGVLRVLERGMRRMVGSGYWNEGEGGAVGGRLKSE